VTRGPTPAHSRRIADSRHPFPIYMGGGFCFLGKSFGAFLKLGIEVSSPRAETPGW
jgi:hypothetical protein